MLCELFLFHEFIISNIYLVYLRAVGGESASPAALAPKVGPLGMVCISYLVIYFIIGSQEGW